MVILASIRRTYRFEEGSLVIIEPRPQGILLRPVITLPLEIYTNERKAAFLLNNTVTPEDYASAVQQVCKMGLDPEKIPHSKSAGA